MGDILVHSHIPKLVLFHMEQMLDLLVLMPPVTRRNRVFILVLPMVHHQTVIRLLLDMVVNFPSRMTLRSRLLRPLRRPSYQFSYFPSPLVLLRQLVLFAENGENATVKIFFSMKITPECKHMYFSMFQIRFYHQPSVFTCILGFF